MKKLIFILLLIPVLSYGQTTFKKAVIFSDAVTLTSNNTLTLSSTATTYDDLFFPSHQLKKVGTTGKPDDDNVSMELLFPEDTTESVGMVVQLPHDWKQGSTIYPHIHWAEESADSVHWIMRYKWYNIGAAKPGTWTTYTIYHKSQTYVSGTIHQISNAWGNPGISGSGKTMSSVLVIKLYRGADNYTGDARFIQFDIHYERDGFGSKTEYSK